MNCGLIPTFVSCTNCTNQTEGGVSGSLRAAIIRSRAGTSWNLIGRPCCAISTGIKVWLRVEYLSLVSTEQLISFTHPPHTAAPPARPPRSNSLGICFLSFFVYAALCLRELFVYHIQVGVGEESHVEALEAKGQLSGKRPTCLNLLKNRGVRALMVELVR